MGRWLVGRAEVEDLVLPGPTPEERDTSRLDEMTAWMRSLGVDPKGIALCAVVTHDAAGGDYLLHLSEYVLDDKGRKQIDHAADVLYRRPVVVPIEEGSWPDWLTGLHRV